MTPMASDRQFLTVKEVGDLSALAHPSTIYKLVRLGSIPSFRSRHRMAIPRGCD